MSSMSKGFKAHDDDPGAVKRFTLIVILFYIILLEVRLPAVQLTLQIILHKALKTSDVSFTT